MSNTDAVINTITADGSGELSYEQARGELEQVVRRLEAGGLTLEESLAYWERGEHLAEVCQQWLDGARARLERVLPQPPANGPS